MQNKRRDPSLDLLRFVAVILVIGRHLDRCPGNYPKLIRGAFTLIRRGGWVGVDLFFVLSGFLISGLLYSEFKRSSSISAIRFYIRRGLKIWPSLYLMLGCTLVVALFSSQPLPQSEVFSELLFGQSYWQGLWNHTWSIAVEEHFYAVLPLLFLVLVRFDRSLRLVPLITLLVCVYALAARVITYWVTGGYSALGSLFATHLRIDSLFFGVMIGYFFHFHRETFVRRLTPWRYWLISVGACMLLPAYVFQLETTPFVYTAGLTVFYLASGAMLVGMLMSNPTGRLVSWLAWLGECSYSVYLWHVPVKRWLTPDWMPFPLRMAVFVIGSFVLGAALTKWFEDPILAWRNRRWPSKSGSTPLAN